MLTVNNLTKKYGNSGISQISFDLHFGNVMGIVGPNGVGKTTLLQCIAGIIKPDSGNILFDGKPIAYPANSLIGYMPEFPALPRFFTPRQTILYILQMKKNTSDVFCIDKILNSYQLLPFADKCNSTLSQGMQKRVMMAITFLLNPSIILLDEPTNGLDTSGLILLKEKIKECSKSGKIILVSSHVLDFVNAVQGQTLLLSNSEYKVVEAATSLELEVQYMEYFGLR